MGTRETQRRAWREAVARAAEEWGRTDAAVRCYIAASTWDGRGYGLQGLMEDRDPAEMALRDALSAPKPWTRPAKADLGRQVERVQRRLGISDLSMEIDLMTVLVREWARMDLRRKRRAAQRRRR